MLPQHRSSHFGEVKPQGHFDGRHSFNTLTQMFICLSQGLLLTDPSTGLQRAGGKAVLHPRS